MSIFSTSTQRLLSVADGEVIPLSMVNDEAFSSGMLGAGFAVKPANGVVYSPVDGKVMGVAEAKHAYSIFSDGGLEILVHIGLDTVHLGGRSFTPTVKAGDEVRAGDVIAHVDLAEIKKEGYDTVIPVLMSNIDGSAKLSPRLGYAEGGRTAVLKLNGGKEVK